MKSLTAIIIINNDQNMTNEVNNTNPFVLGNIAGCVVVKLATCVVSVHAVAVHTGTLLVTTCDIAVAGKTK